MRLKGFQELTPIDEALNRFFSVLRPKTLEAQFVPLTEGFGRIAAENVVAGKALPSFNRSAVDGYAVKARDTFKATQFKPKTFRLVQKGANRYQIKNGKHIPRRHRVQKGTRL